MMLFAFQIDNYKGEYDAAVNYKKGEIVTDGINTYLSLQDNTGIPTSNNAYWAILPSASVDRSYTLNDIADVDLNTVPPVDNHVLTFESGLWVPKALTSGGSSIILGEWVIGGGEPVELLDEIPPQDVSNVSITYLDKNSLVLNWMESVSTDVKDYVIYNGPALAYTVPATVSKLQPLTLQVTGLIPATNYSFTIKARDYVNNEASGVSISTRTHGNSAILMNGTTDYIKLPSLTFDTIELTCVANLGPVGVWYYYVDARTGGTTAYFAINGNGNVQYGPAWTRILVNSLNPIDLNTVKNNKMTLTLGLASSATDDINIFSDYQNKPAMMGKIYSIRILNRGTVVASYNLTESFIGTSIADTSGNGKTATLIGGTWTTG